MTEPFADPRDRRMRLRYADRCRLCRVALAPGSVGIVERHLGTVRCEGCASSGPARPLVLPPVAPPPASAAPPMLRAAAAAPAPTLDRRAPASALIAKVLDLQARMPPQTNAQRRFGADPLCPEARTWYAGALGEVEVGQRLAGLGPEWRSVHSLPVGSAGSDIDHVVIGPAGVCTINTKRSRGARVWVGARRLLVDGRKTDHLRNAEFEARRTTQAVSRAVGQPVAVRPLLVFVGASRITFKQTPERVVVLHAQHLSAWLRRAGTALTAAQIDAVHRAVTDPVTWGSPPAPLADLAAFDALRSAVEGAARRRTGWIVAAVLCAVGIVPLLGLITFVVLGPLLR